MLSENECSICGLPAEGAVICSVCLGRLERRLGEVPGLLPELETTIAKLDETGIRNGSAPKPVKPPLPFDTNASDVRDRLRDILVGWAVDVAERHGEALPAWPRGDSDNEAAKWLSGHLRAIQHHPAAEDIHDEVRDAVRMAYAVIDQPPDRVFRGWCCVGLYADPARTTIRCPECHTEYDAEDARQALMAKMWDQWVSPNGAHEALKALGVKVTPERIRQWKRRGKITSDDSGMYRLGDVIQVASAIN